jgi:hypothetical protein
VLPISTAVAYGLGGVLFAIGLVVKVWATLIVGVDVYYYRDMFLGKKVAGFAATGPYRYLANPMYGVGQLHAYGYAVLHRSLPGLLAVLVCHVLIYGFYYAAERPFIKRVYFSPQA